MGHELEPDSGELLPLQMIVERLRGEFRHVRVDREAALSQARAHARWIENANPQIFLGRHEEALARAARLGAVGLNDVLWVEFGDDPDNTRHFVLWPGESIKFGYAGTEDEELARPLLIRCARALECTLTLF